MQRGTLILYSAIVNLKRGWGVSQYATVLFQGISNEDKFPASGVKFFMHWSLNMHITQTPKSTKKIIIGNSSTQEIIRIFTLKQGGRSAID